MFVNNEIIKIENNKVYLKNGEQLMIDFIIASIGVLPDTELAAKAGLNLGIKGGIVVDEKYRTSDPHIYAVGDAVIVKNQINNQTHSFHWLLQPIDKVANWRIS